LGGGKKFTLRLRREGKKRVAHTQSLFLEKKEKEGGKIHGRKKQNHNPSHSKRKDKKGRKKKEKVPFLLNFKKNYRKGKERR